MDFVTIRTEVANRAHLDVTADATRLNRRINLAQAWIVGASRWWWLITRAIVQTVVDYTTGTVAVTLSSATVTGTSTVWTSAMVGRFIQVGSDTNRYEITAVASNTSLTITPAYGSATATAQTYTIRAMFYSLASNVDTLYDMRQPASPLKLVEVTPRTFDEVQPDYDATGKPRGYIVWPRTAAGLWQVQLYPVPDAVINLEYRYFRTIADLSADADISEIPVKWHWMIVEKALLFYLEELGDEGAIVRQQALVKEGLEQMLANNQPSVDAIPVLRGHPMSRGRWQNFGDDFEQPI